MSSQPPKPTAAQDPLVRSDIYRLLSLVFKYPSAEVYEGYRSGELLSALWSSLSELPSGASVLFGEEGFRDCVRNDFESRSLVDLEVEYNKTFEVGAPEPPCPPNEGLYRKKEMERAPLLIEVAEFYKQFGLKMSAEEGKRELPDCLQAELEFLSFLAIKEAQAAAAGDGDLLTGYVHAQRDFLARHLAAWVPAFSEKLQSTDSLELFRGAGRIAQRFVAADTEYVGRLYKERAPEAEARPKEGPEAASATTVSAAASQAAADSAA